MNFVKVWLLIIKESFSILSVCQWWWISPMLVTYPTLSYSSSYLLILLLNIVLSPLFFCLRCLPLLAWCAMAQLVPIHWPTFFTRRKVFSPDEVLFTNLLSFHLSFLFFCISTGQFQFGGFRGVHWHKRVGWHQPGDSPVTEVDTTLLQHSHNMTAPKCKSLLLLLRWSQPGWAQVDPVSSIIWCLCHVENNVKVVSYHNTLKSGSLWEQDCQVLKWS